MIVTQIIAGVAQRTGVAAALGRVIDAVIQRVDLQAILDRLDLTAIVLDRVDLELIVREVLKRLDEEELRNVLSRVDVDEVVRRVDVEAVLDRVDLTAVVLNRVDLQAVVDAALAHIDLVGLSEQVIDEVNLPEIIRESTDSMASDTVERIRLQGMDADRAVSRAVNRLLLRRRGEEDEPRP